MTVFLSKSYFFLSKSFGWFCWVLLDICGVFWVLLDICGFFWVLLGILNNINTTPSRLVVILISRQILANHSITKAHRREWTNLRPQQCDWNWKVKNRETHSVGHTTKKKYSHAHMIAQHMVTKPADWKLRKTGLFLRLTALASLIKEIIQ